MNSTITGEIFTGDLTREHYQEDNTVRFDAEGFFTVRTVLQNGCIIRFDRVDITDAVRRVLR